MRLVLLACLLGAAALSPALAQPRAGWQAPPPAAAPPLPRQPPRYGPDSLLPQLDVTPLLLELPPPMAEPLPQRRPMFSQGWTRDGFGTQSGGWR